MVKTVAPLVSYGELLLVYASYGSQYLRDPMAELLVIK